MPIDWLLTAIRVQSRRSPTPAVGHERSFERGRETAVAFPALAIWHQGPTVAVVSPWLLQHAATQ